MSPVSCVANCWRCFLWFHQEQQQQQQNTLRPRKAFSSHTFVRVCVCVRYLGHLLQVRPKVLPGDVGQAEGRHHLRLGEVQPPRLGEEVGLALGEPRVVQRRRQVDLGAEHRPPVVLGHHRGAVAQSPPIACRAGGGWR